MRIRCTTPPLGGTITIVNVWTESRLKEWLRYFLKTDVDGFV